VGWGWVWGVGVTADDVRGCYDPILPLLPRFSCLFVEVKFELTVVFCRNKVCRSSRIRNNPPLSITLHTYQHLVQNRQKRCYISSCVLLWVIFFWELVEIVHQIFTFKNNWFSTGFKKKPGVPQIVLNIWNLVCHK